MCFVTTKDFVRILTWYDVIKLFVRRPYSSSNAIVWYLGLAGVTARQLWGLPRQKVVPVVSIAVAEMQDISIPIHNTMYFLGYSGLKGQGQTGKVNFLYRN